MPKWVKVSLWSAAVVVVGGATAAAIGWHLVRGTPDWYAADPTTPLQRQSAARRAEDTLVRLYDWSAGRHARAVRAAAAFAPPSRTARADEPFQLEFTDEQLNAFFGKWTEPADRQALIERYVHDPRVAVRDGQIILAGQVKDVGLVVSLVFEPAIDAHGQLRLTLARVLAGMLPVPDAAWARQRAAVERVLRDDLPNYQRQAALTPDGLANGDLASAGMNQLLLDVLARRSADPVVFVPVNVTSMWPSLPVRITAVTAKDHTLSMTAQAMTAVERQALLDRVRTPVAAGDDAATP